jgi:hypothetical protein
MVLPLVTEAAVKVYSPYRAFDLRLRGPINRRTGVPLSPPGTRSCLLCRSTFPFKDFICDRYSIKSICYAQYFYKSSIVIPTDRSNIKLRRRSGSSKATRESAQTQRNGIEALWRRGAGAGHKQSDLKDRKCGTWRGVSLRVYPLKGCAGSGAKAPGFTIWARCPNSKSEPSPLRGEGLGGGGIICTLPLHPLPSREGKSLFRCPNSKNEPVWGQAPKTT